MRIYLVDDHFISLQDLARKIEQSEVDTEIVGQSTGAKKASAEIIALKPDVVFTDIEMPVMNGLELMDCVKRANCHPIFVAVSAFEDFEYVRGALKLGAQDYLLKPTTQSDVNTLLVQLSSSILSDARKTTANRLFESLSKSVDVEDDNLYELTLLTFGSYQTLETNEFLKDTDYPFLEQMNHFLIREENKEPLLYVIEGDMYNELCVVEKLADGKQKSFFEQEKLNRVFEKQVTMITTGEPLKLTQLFSTKNHLRLATRQLLIFSESNKFNLSSVPTISNKQLPIFQNRETVIDDLSLFLGEAKKESLTQTQLVQNLTLFFSKWSKWDREANNFSDLKRSELELFVAQSEDYQQLQYRLLVELDKRTDDSSKITTQEKTVHKAKLFMENNLEKSISMTDVADKVLMSPTYFSKIFKEQEGLPPGEYLTNKRIEKAKYLLLNSQLTIKSIAASCGYEDSLYFSKVFKQKVKQTPTDFKLNVQNDK